MAEGFELRATRRERVGKGAARALRREGMVPAVIYGGKQPPVPIAIPYKETNLRLHAGGFLTNIFTIDVEGQKIKALARDYQLEPVRDFLWHVDFLRVTETTRATVDVPVHFVNEDASPALRDGAVLQVVSHTVPLDCPAGAIPDVIEVDLSGLETGATVHASELELPANVELGTGAEELTIATITAPRAMTEAQAEQAEAEAVAEGEAQPEAEAGEGEEES